MINISESEALVILSQPKFCNDCAWVDIKTQLYAKEASVGLVDESGKNMRLLVQLICQMHPTAGFTKYMFTLFSQKITGLERVYQLEVKQYKKVVKSLHQLPHEHIGDNRKIGSDTWASRAMMKYLLVSSARQILFLSLKFHILLIFNFDDLPSINNAFRLPMSSSDR